MIIVWYTVLGSFLLAAFITGLFGILCTQSRRDLIPGLCFGLPAVILSLLVFTFCVSSHLFAFSGFAVPSLVIGLAAIWRGLRTGDKLKDRRTAGFVFASFILTVTILVACPAIANSLFTRFLPGSPIL